MSSTRTAPDLGQLLTTIGTGWNDALQGWWDQSQSALDPWLRLWAPDAPAAGHRHCHHGMPGARHGHGGGTHAHGSRHGDPHRHEGGGPCGRDDGSWGCHDPRECDDCCECQDLCECQDGCECHDPERCHDVCEHDPGGCSRSHADVVVHARVGEMRVVPFLLRNPWRRSREVTIGVGPWQVCGDRSLTVASRLDEVEPLALEPCESRVVRLGVTVQAAARRGTEAGGEDDGGGEQREVEDLESCASASADLRFDGCARFRRICVVVHRGRCAAVRVPCDCGCC